MIFYLFPSGIIIHTYTYIVIQPQFQKAKQITGHHICNVGLKITQQTVLTQYTKTNKLGLVDEF